MQLALTCSSHSIKDHSYSRGVNLGFQKEGANKSTWNYVKKSNNTD